MSSILAFYLKPFRNGSQLKLSKTQIARNKKHFQTAVTSEEIIEKIPGWSHSLCLIELFLDVTNF
jgi:hypothetical protein